MSRYQPYPSYKDSGVEWLGDMPEGWKAWKLAHAFNIGSGTTPKSENQAYYENGTIPWLNTGDLNDNSLYDCNKKITKIAFAECGLKIYPENSLVIAMYGATIGKLSLLKFSTTVNQACCVFSEHENKIQVNFLFYCLLGFRQHIISLAIGGGQPNINQDILKNFKIASPSISEQSTIANFLDRETAKIDTLITKQERMIELLNEKRSNVIAHSITKGLDPNVKMKDSGVDWLGEVPEHWETKKFKYLFQIKKRIAGKLGYDILSITQKGIKIKDTESGAGQLSSDYSKYQHVEKGDFAMNHMDLLTGFVDLSKYDGVTSPDYRVFSLSHHQSLPEYYLYLLQMGYFNKIFYPFGQGASQLGRWRLQTEAFNEFLAPCPPKKEQEEIIKFIERNLNRFDILSQKANKAIELLKERRMALISAVVTGKIDVRGYNVG